MSYDIKISTCCLECLHIWRNLYGRGSTCMYILWLAKSDDLSLYTAKEWQFSVWNVACQKKPVCQHACKYYDYRKASTYPSTLRERVSSLSSMILGYVTSCYVMSASVMLTLTWRCGSCFGHNCKTAQIMSIEWMGKTHFCFLQTAPGLGNEPRTLTWKAAVLTTTLFLWP